MFVRSDIVMNASLYLKKAVTIAIRYNAVRRQSNRSSTDKKEMPVLDYQHSLRNLLPLVATAYAFHFTSGAMRKLYNTFEEASRRTGDFSALPELHATSSGLKALCSWTTKDAIETCRCAAKRRSRPCAYVRRQALLPSTSESAEQIFGSRLSEPNSHSGDSSRDRSARLSRPHRAAGLRVAGTAS